METKSPNTELKHVFFKVYKTLPQLEKAIEVIKETDNQNLKVSILGKIPQNYSNKEKTSTNAIDAMKMFCKIKLGNTIDFGSFFNPKIGMVFIAGSLTPMFCHRINGKILGEMSTGLYGILRGLGAHQFQAETYLKTINAGNYLLIVRGFNNELYHVENALKRST